MVVRFDGWSRHTPGDRIIIGASNYPDWNTNDGNIGLYVFDEAHAVNNFSHSRVYDVEPGVQTFYAVAQNYVDLDGSGIASIDGKLTVEYVPATAHDLIIGHSTVKDEFFWDPAIQVIQSVTLDVPSAGEVIVQLDGEVAIVNEVENLYTISDSPAWPQDGNIIVARTTDISNDIPIVQRKRYAVTPGTHTYYVLGQRTVGDPQYSDDYIYATLTARFIASGSDEVAVAHANVTPAMILPAIPQRVGRVQLMAPADGTVSVQATGVLTSELNSHYVLYLVPADDPAEVLDARLIEPLQADVTDTYYALSAAQSVPAGLHTYDLMAAFADGSPATDDALIAGLMTIQWIAKPVISATQEIYNGMPLGASPNPTSGLVTLTIPGASGNGDVHVVDLRGQLVRSFSDVQLDGFQADLRELGAGMYVLHASAGNMIHVGSVVKL